MRALALCLVVLAAPAVAQEAERGYIGIHPAELNKEVRTHFKIAEGVDRGLVLTKVFDNSAAAKAGLRVGDVLTSFNNRPVNSIDELIKLLDGMKPGRRVAYVARRGSGTIAGLLVLGKPPSDREIVPGDPILEEKPAKKRTDDLDARMTKAKKEIEELRARAERRKAEATKQARRGGKGGKGATARRGRAPRNIVGWMEREEERIVAAKKSGNQRAIQWHSARMQMLRELREAGYNTPTNARRGGDNANREQAEKRMRKLEAQLAQVLDRLAKIENNRR